MSRASIDVTNEIIGQRLIKSVEDANLNDLEIAFAIQANYLRVIEKVYNVFFQNVDSLLPNLKRGGEISAKKDSRIYWRKDEWPKALSIGFSFENENFKGFCFGISAPKKNSVSANRAADGWYVSDSLHQELAAQRGRISLNICEGLKSEGYSPLWQWINVKFNANDFSGCADLIDKDSELVKLTVLDINILSELIEESL